MANILLLDAEPDEEYNFGELLFRTELEKRKHNVTTVHCGEGSVIEHTSTGAFITCPKRNINMSWWLRNKQAGGIKDLMAETALEEMKKLRPGLIELKNDGEYLVYPKVAVNIDQFDGVALAPSLTTMAPATAVQALGALEDAGVTVLSRREPVEIANSKILSHEAFLRFNETADPEDKIPLPKTFCVRYEEEYDETRFREELESLGSQRFVIKPEYGAGAKGTWVAANTGQALDFIRESYAGRTGFVVQEEIPGGLGAPQGDAVWSIRVLVLGGEVIGVYNPEWGNDQSVDRLTERQKNAAINAVAATGLFFGGVDLGGTPQEPVVFETNATPDIVYHEYYQQSAAGTLAAWFIARIQGVQKPPVSGR